MLVTLLVPLAIAVAPPGADASPQPAGARFVQFNVWELSQAKVDEVDEAGRGTNPQLRKAAAILQTLRPDVLLLNEIDCAPDEPTRTARLFAQRYLAVPQGGRPHLVLPHVFAAPVNTGEPSGLDLDHDGTPSEPEDAWGFGRYPGQYGLALLTRFDIDAAAARTFRLLRWAEMPGHLIPDGRDGRPAYYPEAVASRLRLSSKTHLDVPVRIGGVTLHVLAAHPTPGVFDGPEDSNGRRNHDEIRLLADYIRGGEAAAWIKDDAGHAGGLPPGAKFVVMGDMNADPDKDPGPYGGPAVDQLLSLGRLTDPVPHSAGAAAADSTEPAGPHPERRTSAYGRIDYVLPSRDLAVRDTGVFWPAPDAPDRDLIDAPDPASDHRAVWLDVALPD